MALNNSIDKEINQILNDEYHDLDTKYIFLYITIQFLLFFVSLFLSSAQKSSYEIKHLDVQPSLKSLLELFNNIRELLLSKKQRIM